jgi:hypothetical protein
MIQADIRQTALKGKLSGFWWGVGGSVGGYGRASASSRTGQAAMEWNFGRGARVTERSGPGALVGVPLSLLVPRSSRDSGG